MVLPPLLLLNNSFIIDFSNIFHASVVRHPTGGGGASITAAMFEAGLLLWALSALCGFFWACGRYVQVGFICQLQPADPLFTCYFKM